MRSASWADGLLEGGLGDPEVAALVGWDARIARMVDVEAALGRALAATGLIPADAGAAITRACDVGRLDLDRLASAAAAAPTPVIPLLAALVDGAEPQAAAWLHHGATSQDVVDTAVVLQARDALDVLDDRLATLAARCADLADGHRDTVMAGRTLGQQAVPITFGLKAARWLTALDRRRQQLAWLRPRLLQVQLGGAAGTSAVYGDRGLDVAAALAAELGLGVPELPWHGERDRVAELAGALAAIAGVAGQIATDLLLLAQSEVAEVWEAAGDGPGSSAMPHKRNPMHAVCARAAARLAAGDCQVLLDASSAHEHERAAGAWQAEWVALPSALVRTAGALTRLDASLAGLEVDATRMRANLDALYGLSGSEALSTALTTAMGRPAAQALAGELATRAALGRRSLTEVAVEEPRVTAHLAADEVTRALDPSSVTRSTGPLIDRALALHDRNAPGGDRNALGGDQAAPDGDNPAPDGDAGAR